MSGARRIFALTRLLVSEPTSADGIRRLGSPMIISCAQMGVRAPPTSILLATLWFGTLADVCWKLHPREGPDTDATLRRQILLYGGRRT